MLIFWLTTRDEVVCLISLTSEIGILLASLGPFIPHQCIIISATHCSSTIVLYVCVFDEINK